MISTILVDLAINVPLAAGLCWWSTSRYVRKAYRRSDREHRAHMMTVRVLDPTGFVLLDIDCEQLALIHRYGSMNADRSEWFQIENLGGFSLQCRPTHPVDVSK